jgi:hypothetical protein
VIKLKTFGRNSINRSSLPNYLAALRVTPYSRTAEKRETFCAVLKYVLPVPHKSIVVWTRSFWRVLSSGFNIDSNIYYYS